jgi:hypothetical protein
MRIETVCRQVSRQRNARIFQRALAVSARRLRPSFDHSRVRWACRKGIYNFLLFDPDDYGARAMDCRIVERNQPFVKDLLKPGPANRICKEGNRHVRLLIAALSADCLFR